MLELNTPIINPPIKHGSNINLCQTQVRHPYWLLYFTLNYIWTLYIMSWCYIHVNVDFSRIHQEVGCYAEMLIICTEPDTFKGYKTKQT